jgi:hypothetical protein
MSVRSCADPSVRCHRSSDRVSRPRPAAGGALWGGPSLLEGRPTRLASATGEGRLRDRLQASWHSCSEWYWSYSAPSRAPGSSEGRGTAHSTHSASIRGKRGTSVDEHRPPHSLGEYPGETGHERGRAPPTALTRRVSGGNGARAWTSTAHSTHSASIRGNGTRTTGARIAQVQRDRKTALAGSRRQWCDDIAWR